MNFRMGYRLSERARTTGSRIQIGCSRGLVAIRARLRSAVILAAIVLLFLGLSGFPRLIHDPRGRHCEVAGHDQERGNCGSGDLHRRSG
jgi:hypothetical protein